MSTIKLSTEAVMGDALVLTQHWCKVIEEPNTDCSNPGIYPREIEDAGRVTITSP